MIEVMAAIGILGEYKGSQAREVMVTEDEYEKIRQQMADEDAQQYQNPTPDEDDVALAKPGHSRALIVIPAKAGIHKS